MRARLAIALVLAACTNAKTVTDPNATGIEVFVQLDPSQNIDQVRVTATVASFDGAAAIQPGTVPGAPRPLHAMESVVILVPAAMAGTTLAVRVDGLAAGTIVASAGATAAIRAKELVRVDVALGAPAICGDGVVTPPLETCDDHNTVSADGCSASCFVEPGWLCTPALGPSRCMLDTFDVASASSISNTKLEIAFSAPPDPTTATSLANYNVPGLTLGGVPFLAGNTVTVTTSSQDGIDYNTIVTGVTRASDGKPLTTKLATFTGRTSFNVASARSTNTTAMTVTFDAPPDPATATAVGNYAVNGGLVLSGAPVLAGSTVTLTTSAQTATTYRVTVSNVKRATDAEPLTTQIADFSGRNGFDVAAAASTGNREITVTFNAAPNAAQATTGSNYSVPGLVLGTPTLAGNTVTIPTSAQLTTTYTVTVANVTRASDAQVLGINSAMFTGTVLQDPTVTKVAVTSTSPNNGAVPYNTGTVTLTITGTQFATVTCPSGVMLDDLNGADKLVNTHATTCTVDRDSQITATFPAGIRTNAATGWNVIVTNARGSNTTSAKFVPVAGLLVSEVLILSNGNTAHQYLELYNPTSTALTWSALGGHLHQRDASGVDVDLPLTAITAGTMRSHGYLLFVSAASSATDPWFAHRDLTYPTSMVFAQDFGVYVSLGAAANAKVIDKAGWGSQPVNGYEGTAVANMGQDDCIERKPAGALGHATDTDNNAADFVPPGQTCSPEGTMDPAQP